MTFLQTVNLLTTKRLNDISPNSKFTNDISPCNSKRHERAVFGPGRRRRPQHRVVFDPTVRLWYSVRSQCAGFARVRCWFY